MRNLTINTVAAFAILALAGAAPVVLPGQVSTAGASASGAAPAPSEVVVMGEPLNLSACLARPSERRADARAMDLKR